MTWKNAILKAKISSFNYTTELNRRRDGNSFSITGGKGVYEVDFASVSIYWSLTIENSSDSIYIQEPKIEKISVLGVYASFDEDFDAADVEYEIQDVDVVLEDVKADIEYSETLYGELPMTLLPKIDAEIVRDGDGVKIDNVTIYFE